MTVYSDEPEQMFKEACVRVERGLSVIPTGGGISPKAKQPHHEALKATGHFTINREGKRRSSWKEMQRRLPTREELEAWYLEHRARGLGIVTGQVSGWVVIDVDPAGLGLLQELGWAPHVLTPSGGAHLYLKHPGWYVASNASHAGGTLPPGFDVRGDGGYIMAPPSRNRAGTYRRTDVRRALDIEAVPEEVTVDGVIYPLRAALGLVRPAPVAKASRSEGTAPGNEDDQVPVWLMIDRAAEYASESRNKGAFMFGLWMHANGYLQSAAERHVEEYVGLVADLRHGQFTLKEARQAVASAYRYDRQEPWVRQEQDEHAA
ncbi:bifunctional DNA primase/polymerase [Deinococcus aquaedulcis]|uniref:bifunctional DNA primase/polymerase n=1 Tax=Deinococcus aquaedulcis TaxID=2840455 RepID=UPI001C83EB9D|nr:bifunctional DNA primase/polymerase [Deinococcus aquaedulcis]